MALDIGVVNPQAASHVQQAAGDKLGAATAYTETKRTHNNTDERCLQAGIDYQPIVYESTGGIAKEGMDTLKSLNRLVALNTNTPYEEVARRFYQRVSFDLQRANHRAFARRVARAGDVRVSAGARIARRMTGLARVLEEEDWAE